MQSGREDTLEERYAIKFCFKLVIDTHEQEDFHGSFQKLLERYNINV